MGDVTLNGSSGNTTTILNTLNGHQAHISGDFTYQGGSGSDNLDVGAYSYNLTNLTIGGITSFRAGGGDDGLYFNGVDKLTLSHLDAHTGTGAFSLELRGQDLQIGSLEIRGGGAYRSDIGIVAENFWLAGDLVLKNLATYNSRTGEDVGLSLATDITHVTIGGDIHISNPHASVQFDLYADSGSFGSVHFQGGKHADTIGIRSAEVGQLQSHGNINLHFGTGSNSQTDITGVNILGNVNITSHSTPSQTEPGLTATDYVAIYSTTIHGSTSIIQNNKSEGFIFIRDSSFHSQLNIHTGAGNDKISFGYEYYWSPLPPTQNHFHGPVNIQLGSGDDRILFDVNIRIIQDYNTFHSTLLVNGGPGSNQLIYSTPEDTFATPPTFQNITVTEINIPFP